jgi:hypothetical protein
MQYVPTANSAKVSYRPLTPSSSITEAEATYIHRWLPPGLPVLSRTPNTPPPYYLVSLSERSIFLEPHLCGLLEPGISIPASSCKTCLQFQLLQSWHRSGASKIHVLTDTQTQMSDVEKNKVEYEYGQGAQATSLSLT